MSPRIPSAAKRGPRRLVVAERRIEDLQKIGPQGWVYVGDWPTEAFTTSISPPWENDLTFVAGRRVKFRWGIDGGLEFDGAYDLTQGYVSGQVGYTLPPEFLGETFEDFIPVEVDTDVWSAGVMTVDGDTGEVRIFWPIVADPMP